MQKKAPCLRILVLTTSYPLPGNPASGIFVRRLIHALPEYIDPFVVTPDDASVGQRSDKDGRVGVHAFRYAPKTWQVLAHRPGGIPAAMSSNVASLLLLPLFLLAMFLSTLIKGVKADVIHANWSVCGVVAGVCGLVLRVPVLTTLRGEDVTRGETSRLYRLILDLCLRLSCRVVLVSESMCKQLMDRYPAYAGKMSFIPNGVSEEFMRVNKSVEKRNSSPMNLLFIGSLIRRKGLMDALRGIRNLGTEVKVRLTVVGDGPEKEALIGFCKENAIDEKVIFAGVVEPARIAGMMEGMDALILPSYNEGRPNVVVEAMAAALPVIATDINGVRELIQQSQAGVLVTPGDVNGWEHAIRNFYDDPDSGKRMGALGRRYILKNGLTWSSAGGRYARLYEGLYKAGR